MKNNIPSIENKKVYMPLEKSSGNTSEIESHTEYSNIKIDNIKSIKLEKSENKNGLVKESITFTF